MSDEVIALRAWAEPGGSAHATARRKPPAIAPVLYALVIDTETTIDATQALNFGSYRFIALDDGKNPPGSCLEEGIFYADDLAERYPEGLAVLREFVEKNRADLDVNSYRKPLKLYSRSEFVKEVFYRAAYKAKALVVGFNLPFDLSRLAVGVADARRSYGGGFSFALWDYEDKDGVRHADPNRPRLVIKSLNSKQHLFRFTDRRAGDAEDYELLETEGGAKRRKAFSGHFLDLRTLAFALTDKSYSLERACVDFTVEHPKQKAAEHGKITPKYIRYNRRDVKSTAELLIKLLAEFERHPIPLQVTKAFSPASVAKAYQKAMSLEAVLARQPKFPRDKLGYAMNAFFGGRAECRIRRRAMPVVYTDFVSMYPTVNALLGNWALLTAGEIHTVEATNEVSAFLGDVQLEDCFCPETWKRFSAYVKVRPQGDTFPVRAKYDPHGPSWQIGSNPLTSEEGVWFALPDVVAAKLLTGKTPEVIAAFRLEATGSQEGMCETKLRGTVPVDPNSQDFFRLVIEERKRTQANADLEATERERLQRALKVTANAGSYGIFAEMNRKEQPGNRKSQVAVWNNDGQPFMARVAAPEEPGHYCFPPLAALITSAARLMLALLECSVRERGGTYVFCDTDSLAIVGTEHGGLLACPGGERRLDDSREAVKALSWAEVEAVRERFAALNPYDPEAVRGSVLKAEDENADEETGTQRELFCYSISAKRYVLYNLGDDGRPVIRKYSRHGLGHLLNPSDPDSREHDWIEEIWRYIIAVDVLGHDPAEPDWFAHPALGRVGINDPRTLALFAGLNKGKPYAAQVKPQNFLLSAQVDPLGHPPGVDPLKPFHLIAPYNADPRQWLKLRFTDRYSGEAFRITVGDSVAQGVARVKTYGDVVAEYRCHREHKSLAPDGQPCSRATVGLLQRRPVTAVRVLYVGKESNRLEDVEHGLVKDEDEVMNEYADPRDDPFTKFVVPVLRTMTLSRLVAESGLNLSTIKRIRAGKQRPHARNRKALSELAVRHARAYLAAHGRNVPREDLAALHARVTGGHSEVAAD